MNIPEWLRDYRIYDFGTYESCEAVYLFLLMGDRGLEFVSLMDDVLWEEFYRQLAEYLPKYLAERSIQGS